MSTIFEKINFFNICIASYMDLLPYEILSIIVNYLDDKSKLELRKCNRRLSGIEFSLNDHYYKIDRFVHYNKLDSHIFKTIRKIFISTEEYRYVADGLLPHITHIHFKADLIRTNFEELCARMIIPDHIKSINYGCNKLILDEHNIHKVIKKTLTELYIEHYSYKQDPKFDIFTETTLPTNLKLLSLYGNHNKYDLNLFPKTLQTLIMSPQQPWRYETTVYYSVLPNLKKLAINILHLKLVSSFQNITHLVLYPNVQTYNMETRVMDLMNLDIYQLPIYLTYLSFDHNARSYYDYQREFIDKYKEKQTYIYPLRFTNLPYNLTYLNLTNTHSEDNTLVLPPNLKVLFTGKNIIKSMPPSLTHLSIQILQRIPDLPNLTHLAIKCYYHYDITKVNLPKLTYLNINTSRYKYPIPENVIFGNTWETEIINQLHFHMHL